MTDLQFANDRAFFLQPNDPNHAESLKLLEKVAANALNHRHGLALNTPVSEAELKQEEQAILNDPKRVQGVRAYAESIEYKEHHRVAFGQGAQVQFASLPHGAFPEGALSRQEQLARDREFFTDKTNPHHARNEQLLDWAAQHYVNLREHHPDGTAVSPEKMQQEANAILHDPKRLHGVRMFADGVEHQEAQVHAAQANLDPAAQQAFQDNKRYFAGNAEHMSAMQDTIKQRVHAMYTRNGQLPDSPELTRIIENETVREQADILRNPQRLAKWHENVKELEEAKLQGVTAGQGHPDPRVAQSFAEAKQAMADPRVQAAMEEARPYMLAMKSDMRGEMLEYTRAIHHANSGHGTQQDFDEIRKAGADFQAMEGSAARTLGDELRLHGLNPDDPGMKNLANVSVNTIANMMLKEAETSIRLEEAHNAPPQNTLPDGRLKGGAKVIKI